MMNPNWLCNIVGAENTAVELKNLSSAPPPSNPSSNHGKVISKTKLNEKKVHEDFQHRLAYWTTRLSELEQPHGPPTEGTYTYGAQQNLFFGRSFNVMYRDHRGVPRFLPKFLMNIHSNINSPGCVAHLIRCFPYVDVRTSGVEYGLPPVLLPPSITAVQRDGRPDDHALLHASLLNGVTGQDGRKCVNRVFVCVGTNWMRQRHMWVMTTDEEHQGVRFWEASKGMQYILPERFQDAYKGYQYIKVPDTTDMEKSEQDKKKEKEKAKKDELTAEEMDEEKKKLITGDEDKDKRLKFFWDNLGEYQAEMEPHEFKITPKNPYRTIDLVFDRTNVWANLQHPDPGCIFYDLWNPDLWMPFAPNNKQEIDCPFAEGVHFLPPYNQKRVLEIKAELDRELPGLIKEHRAEAGPYWTEFIHHNVMDNFLVYGLSLLHKMLMHAGDGQKMDDENNEKISEWRKHLHDKIPHRMEMQSIALHFNSQDPQEIKDLIIKQAPFSMSTAMKC